MLQFKIFYFDTNLSSLFSQQSLCFPFKAKNLLIKFSIFKCEEVTPSFPL